MVKMFGIFISHKDNSQVLCISTVNLEIFTRIYFWDSLKRHICDVINSLQGHDLNISVNDRVISLGFYFQK